MKHKMLFTNKCKLIIIEGADRVGKDTLIQNLTLNIVNDLSIKHFSSPPNDEKTIQTYYQQKAFLNEFSDFFHTYNLNNKSNTLTPDVFIWNRSHLGEYVYGDLYRNVSNFDWVFYIESLFFKYCVSDIVLVYLYSNEPELLLKNEDGESLSKNQKELIIKEHKLFLESKKRSCIKNKISIQINNENEYCHSEEIFNELKTFLLEKDIFKEILI